MVKINSVNSNNSEKKNITKNLLQDNSDKQISEHQRVDHSQSSVWLLALSALGVVYGDIGTSPLYALKECFSSQHGLAINETNVLGVLSLSFWSLLMVVTIKYISFVMRADNHGEGGIFALLALVPNSIKDKVTVFQSQKENVL